MILLLKLLTAHFLGDFLLQPKGWVESKEKYKARSVKLYLHILLHGGLVLLLLWDLSLWFIAVLIMFTHGIIDILKLYFQNEFNKVRWFLIDQALHILIIVTIWFLWENPHINLTVWMQSTEIWIFIAALIVLTMVSGILIQILLLKWSRSLDDHSDESLNQAGKYIGVLERLFVFVFVLTDNWEAIGFLLAAKSVFRFGDLKESKDRKLTEYILIGTLLSFGMAIAIGMLVLKMLK